MKLLLIEDDPDLRQTIADYLSAQHYRCETAGDFRTARAKLEDYDYDCIIADLTLPGGDGLQLVQLLQEENRQDGVIIISARAALEDKIQGLRLGADDYLAKPFHLSELSVRIAAIIRRKAQRGSDLVCFEEITVDVAGKQAQVNGEPLELTQKEYDLLLFFILNKNRVLTKNAIATHLWGDYMDEADSYDFIYTHIKNLRKKLEKAGAASYLHSIYGTGYKFSIR